MPWLTLPALLSPSLLMRIAPEKVHYIDLKRLDIAVEQTWEQLTSVEPDANESSDILSHLVLQLYPSTHSFLTAIDLSVNELVDHVRQCEEPLFGFQPRERWKNLRRQEIDQLEETYDTLISSSAKALFWWVKCALPVLFARIAFGVDFRAPLSGADYEIPVLTALKPPAFKEMTLALRSTTDFSDLRVLETEVLKHDLATVHVLAPFKKHKRPQSSPLTRRFVHDDPWSRQQCEAMLRCVWQEKKLSPMCGELLRMGAVRKKTGRSEVRLATRSTFLDRVKSCKLPPHAEKFVKFRSF